MDAKSRILYWSLVATTGSSTASAVVTRCTVTIAFTIAIGRGVESTGFKGRRRSIVRCHMIVGSMMRVILNESIGSE